MEVDNMTLRESDASLGLGLGLLGTFLGLFWLSAGLILGWLFWGYRTPLGNEASGRPT
jgi:hypothetical protein